VLIEGTYTGQRVVNLDHCSSGRVFQVMHRGWRGPGSSFSPIDVLAVVVCSCALILFGLVVDGDERMVGARVAMIGKERQPKPRQIHALRLTVHLPEDTLKSGASLPLKIAHPSGH
jgi:hypothetical protein